MMKILTFLNDAKLMDQVELTQDSAEHRAHVTEVAGRAASFPALELEDRILMAPEEDKIVEYLAEKYEVDMSTLYVYNDYLTGVFSRYRKLMGYVIGQEGGWSGVFPALGIKNMMVLGATGMVGSRITAEARLHGHAVTAVSRSGKGPGPAPGIMGISVDATDPEALEAALKAKGTNVLVVAMGPSRVDTNAPALKDTYASIITAARAVGETLRVFFVGGAGSLEVESGQLVMDQPWFPKEVIPEAQGHRDGLEFLRTVNDVDWTYLSPPPMIQPGERTGQFNVGEGDQVVGQSISAEDYACAAMAEIEEPKHLKTRFTVAN